MPHLHGRRGGTFLNGRRFRRSLAQIKLEHSTRKALPSTAIELSLGPQNAVFGPKPGVSNPVESGSPVESSPLARGCHKGKLCATASRQWGSLGSATARLLMDASLAAEMLTGIRLAGQPEGRAAAFSRMRGYARTTDLSLSEVAGELIEGQLDPTRLVLAG
jgi:hypothetical protein